MKEKKRSYKEKSDRAKGLIEDATEYGEFIATFDAWMTPEELKQRAKHIANLDRER